MVPVNSQQVSTLEYDLYTHMESMMEDGKTYRQMEKITGKDKSWLHRYHKREKAKRHNNQSERVPAVKSKHFISLSHKSSLQKVINEHTDKTGTPEIISLNEDTRSWSWLKYAKHFLDIDLLPHQVQDLKAIESHSRIIINDPRRYGKTFIVEFTFVIRKLCESVFHKEDEPVRFISAVAEVVELFSMDIRHELETNEKIIEHYSYLVDEDPKTKNTTLIINLITRKNRSKHSYKGMTSGSKARGTGTRWCIIDDPIDVFHLSEIPGLTKKILKWIKQKIVPIAKGGSIAVIGTRYDINDIYVQLGAGNWHTIKREAIIKWGTYTIPGQNYKAHEITYEGDWEILAPELFTDLPSDPEADPIQNMLYILEDMGSRDFNQEMQNNPIPLNPDIDYRWYKHVDELPTKSEAMKWIDFVDVAVSEKDGDYTCVPLIGFWNKEYYLVDILHGRWSMLKKIEMIETTIQSWEQKVNTNVRTYIETVMNQRETYQTIRDRPNGINPVPINPKERGTKEFRIMANLALLVEEGKVNIVKGCRNLHVLENESNGFPHYEYDDCIDALDQGLYQLKKRIRSFKYQM